MNVKVSRRHYVYRCFNAAGDLLHVGATSDYDARVKEYEKRPEVAFIGRREHPTRAAAFAAEREAIREQQPLWNLQGKGV